MATPRVFWCFFACFLGVLAIHVVAFDAGLDVLDRDEEFSYEQTLAINSAPGDFQIRMFVPQADPRTGITDETLETDDLEVRFEPGESGHLLTVAGRSGGLPRVIAYRATLTLSAVEYRFAGVESMPPSRFADGSAAALTTFRLDQPPAWIVPAARDSSHLTATEHIQVADPALRTSLSRILGLPTAGAGTSGPTSWSHAEWQAACAQQNLGPLDAVAAIYGLCYDEIRDAQFSGTTDALTALKLGESSCGGKSRLMAAMCRNLGIPTRLVGGVILGDRKSKRTHHVWLECRLAGHWIPFDPLNGYFAALPDRFLRLYTGDLPLISYSRGLSFDYGFRAPAHTVPAVWTASPVSDPDQTGPTVRLLSRTIPLLGRQGFSLILLAPFALLFIVFARQVVGVNTIGVFLPILLGFSLTQTGWIYGFVQIIACFALGAGIRLLLARVNLLHVPRAAVMITGIIVIFLLLSAVQMLAGHEPNASSLILPLAALAMAVEKFVVVAMDKGAPAAFWLLVQTLLVATVCGLILSQPVYQQLMIAFPEIILLVTGLIVAVGNYRDLRLLEHYRFRTLLSARRSS